MPKIFVIAGHGAGDPGAVGNGAVEAEKVRVLANKIKSFGGDNVILGDLNRNYYYDNGISTLTIPKDYQIIELHMDAGVSSARGGHVIINSGFTADKYDNALAAMLKSILPGRSNMIVGRNDLANPSRAAAKGYGYRLVEFGFITNAEDVRIFNSRMDDIARGVLNAFDITVSGQTKISSEGEKEMRAIVQAKSGTGQYYYDGRVFHPLSSPEENKAMCTFVKELYGEDMKTYVFDNKDFKNINNVLAREEKI